MAAHGAHQELLINIVEEPFDVQVNNPVVVPATLACLPYRLMSRFPWSVTVGIRVEVILQFRLQYLLGHHLGYAVSNRGDTQRTNTSVRFRNFHSLDRRRLITAGRQTVPEFV